MKLKELKELAEKATPGPWVWRSPGYLCNKYIEPGLVLDVNAEKVGIERSIEDAEFIAAANPQVVLQLIERIKKLNEAITLATGNPGPWNDDDDYELFSLDEALSKYGADVELK
jgi:hypothetical protein